MAAAASRRPGPRAAALASLFALWTLGWLGAIVFITRDLPSFMPGDARGGVAAFFEAATGQPLWLLMLATGIGAFVLMWTCSRLHSLLDRDDEGWSAMRWVFRARSLNLTLASLAALPIVLLSVDGGRQWLDSAEDVFVVAFLLLSLALPFFALNPATLVRDAPNGWWRASWPGIVAAVAAILLLYVVPVAIGYAIEFVFAGVDERWIPSLQALDLLLTWISTLLAVVVWLCRGRWPVLRRGIARVLRPRALWRCICLHLAWVVPLLFVALPLIAYEVLATYFLPQYADWSRTTGEPLATPIMVVARIGQALHHAFGFMMSICIGLFVYDAALGRLLLRLGIGDASGQDRPDLPGAGAVSAGAGR